MGQRLESRLATAEKKVGALTGRASDEPAGVSSAYIYFMREVNTGFVKVGYATVLHTRHAAIQNANPFPVHVVADVCVCNDDKREAERLVHTMFKDWRFRGEWFRLSNEQIEMAVEALEPFCQRYQSLMGEYMAAKLANTLESLPAWLKG